MSQSSTPFNGLATDPFLPSIDEQQQLAQADFEELFGNDHPVFLSNSSEALDELDFKYDTASLVNVDSSSSSTTFTPDFSSYNFSGNSPAYPTPPGTNSPHPYPLDRQQTYQTTAHQQAYNHRPLPVRSQTNNTCLHPAQPPQVFCRRRSLSHGDIDQIAAKRPIPNPTFIRLQAPRSRSTTPEDKSRCSPYHQHGRRVSQGPGFRGRPMKPTSTPYAQYGSPLVDGMLPTPIGTSLNEMMEVEDLRYGYQDNRAGLSMSSEGPVFRYMTRPDDLVRSRQIIQIGAMVVQHRSRVDRRLEETDSNVQERLLKKLANIEKHLKETKGEEALRGYRMIREALGMTIDHDDVAPTVENDTGTLEAPSKVPDCDMYDGGNELMEMLMRENGVHAHDQGEDSSAD